MNPRSFWLYAQTVVPVLPRGSIQTSSKAVTLYTVCIQLKTQIIPSAGCTPKMINDLLWSEKKHNSEVSRECFNPSYFLTTQTLTKLDEGRVFKSPPCSSSEGGGSQGTLFLLLILRVEHNLMQKSVNMRYRKVIRTRSNGVISCDLP